MRDMVFSRRKARDHVVGRGPLSVRRRMVSLLDRLDEAEAFLLTFHREIVGTHDGFQRRFSTVRRELIRHGYYEHTPEELAFGAKLAWRNHARCIGRLYWDSLEVRDRRHVSDPDMMFTDICQHLKTATGDGRIQSMITVYPALRVGDRCTYVESPQIVQYAGYLSRNGRFVGDRKNVEITKVARTMGWNPPGAPGHFDILPVLIRDAQDRRHIFQLPDRLVKEVAIAHPEKLPLQALRLRWYAVPLVSDFFLTIGGIEYPCAPFNGFYMASEIASRNFADIKRYDLLEPVAERLGLNTKQSNSFWRDEALTELNRAVVHSYAQAGVTLIDHHSASDQFMRFEARERAAGRAVSANWSWIVPPQASAACRVFHAPMQDHQAVPNFYRSRVSDGKSLRVQRQMQDETSLARWSARVRRLQNWGKLSGSR